MVLTNDQVEVTPKGFLATRQFNSFIALDTTSIKFDDEQKAFEYSIELLNLIRITFLANKMCLNFKSSFSIEPSIYYNAINSVLNNNPFSDQELQNYFETEQKKEEFLDFSRSLSDIEEEFQLPYEIDFILLGINMDAYEKLNEDQKGEFHDSYGDIACEVRFKRLEIKDFILKAKELFASWNLINIEIEQ